MKAAPGGSGPPQEEPQAQTAETMSRRSHQSRLATPDPAGTLPRRSSRTYQQGPGWYTGLAAPSYDGIGMIWRILSSSFMPTLLSKLSVASSLRMQTDTFGRGTSLVSGATILRPATYQPVTATSR